MSAPFFCYGSTLIMLYVYLISLNDQISIDELTKLNNRSRRKKYVAGELARVGSERTVRYVRKSSVIRLR